MIAMRRATGLLAALLLAAMAAAAAAQPAPPMAANGAAANAAMPVPRLADAAYGSDPRQRLDLHVPAGVRRPPLVLFVHGGRWFRGSKDQLAEYGRIEALLAAGFAVATINYRYSSTAKWPAQQDDVLAALRWLRDHRRALGVSTDRIALWGQSSGAHLALMAAAELAMTGRSPVKAVVAWFPPSDLARLAQDRDADGFAGEAQAEPSPESLLIGAAVAERPDLADSASPAARIARLASRHRLPPVLLVHGSADPSVSPRQSRRLVAQLNARRPESAQLREVAGGGHGGRGFAAETAPSVAFLRPYLGRPGHR